MYGHLPHLQFCIKIEKTFTKYSLKCWNGSDEGSLKICNEFTSKTINCTYIFFVWIRKFSQIYCVLWYTCVLLCTSINVWSLAKAEGNAEIMLPVCLKRNHHVNATRSYLHFGKIEFSVDNENAYKNAQVKL